MFEKPELEACLSIKSKNRCTTPIKHRDKEFVARRFFVIHTNAPP
jgi:hypothetical protein